LSKFDEQVTEVLGRNVLLQQLLAAGFEVATPVRDRRIDLIAYREQGDALAAFPIQVKAASQAGFVLDRKYGRTSGLVVAYVWYAGDPARSEVFALTYGEALAVAEEMGYTETESWRRGRYVVTAPGPRLRELLDPYRMTPEAWGRKLAPARSAAA
jgi:hypothetical protein